MMSKNLVCVGGPLDGALMPVNGDPHEVVEMCGIQIEIGDWAFRDNEAQKSYWNRGLVTLRGTYRYYRDMDRFRFAAQMPCQKQG
ncbi:MAG: hypothetical protein ACYCQK_01350 [Acidiferrobacteraceae bacterium]